VAKNPLKSTVKKCGGRSQIILIMKLTRTRCHHGLAFQGLRSLQCHLGWHAKCVQLVGTAEHSRFLRVRARSSTRS